MKYLIIALTLISSSAMAEPCRQSSIQGTWWTVWNFGIGNAQCSMRCQLRLDEDGNVVPDGRCRVQMNGQPAVWVHTTGGRIEVTNKRYCDYVGTVETEMFDFSLEVMLSHDWGKAKVSKKGAVIPENASQLSWDGIVEADNGAVGTVRALWRSPFTKPFTINQ